MWAKGPCSDLVIRLRAEKSDLDVFALLSGDATLIEELVSGHEAAGLHPALYLTQLPELRIALGAYRSRLPCRGPSSPSAQRCRPSGVFGPVEAPSVRPTDPFVSHRGLATL